MRKQNGYSIPYIVLIVGKNDAQRSLPALTACASMPDRSGTTRPRFQPNNWWTPLLTSYLFEKMNWIEFNYINIIIIIIVCLFVGSYQFEIHSNHSAFQLNGDKAQVADALWICRAAIDGLEVVWAHVPALHGGSVAQNQMYRSGRCAIEKPCLAKYPSLISYCNDVRRH